MTQDNRARRHRLMSRVTVLKMHHQSMKNYSYLIANLPGSQAVIVDPAWQIEKIDQALRDSQARLTGILITHSHPDHTHLAKPIAEKYDCPIWMSKAEIAFSGFSARQLIALDGAPWTVGQMVIEPIFTPGQRLLSHWRRRVHWGCSICGRMWYLPGCASCARHV